MPKSLSRRSFIKIMGISLGAVGLKKLLEAEKVFAEDVNQKNNNMLIAYFSHTGNTQHVAEIIHRLTGAPLHRITTVETYPAEHDPCSKLAGQQLRANYRPALSSHVDDMGQYSTIFLGYPIWWHTMPMACWTFLEEYNFAGKTIIPFCTSGGDRIATSIADIKKLCPKANVLEGYRTWNAWSDKTPAEIADWLGNIGITIKAPD